VVLNRGKSLAKGVVNKFSGGREPYVLYNIESLINEFNNKYICFYNFFNVKGFQT